MPQLIVQGAQLTCSFGSTPSSMNVLPTNRVKATGKPAATVMDHVAMTNIMPFGMCRTLSNPQVAAATAAANGALTPQPCIPVTTAPWTPGSATVRIGGQMALNNSCKATCAWAGIISITSAGQQTVKVP